MDTLLIVMTVLSLAMAVAMTVVVLKLLADERRRSDARVAALMRASHVPAPVMESAARAREGDLPLRAPAAPAELFAATDAPSSWGPRIAAAAATVAVLAAVGLTVSSPGRPAAAPAPAAARPAVAPLELMTLRHTAEPGSLTVSGIVSNPSAGAQLTRVIATAWALDSGGAVIASGRAPIDLTAFGPGEESPFVVEVATNAPVARYRIGFRAEDGTVIAHVDRRNGSEALAQR